MKKEKPMQKEKAALTAAKKEEYISPQDLLQEIQPLIKEYFLGEFSLEEGAINLVFPNGQNFKLCIQ